MKVRRHSRQSIADSTPADSHWRRHYMCYLAGEKWCQMGNENKSTWKSSTFLFSMKPGLLIQLGYYSSEIYVIWSKTDDILPKSLYPISFEIMTILIGTDNHYRALSGYKMNYSHFFLPWRKCHIFERVLWAHASHTRRNTNHSHLWSN